MDHYKLFIDGEFVEAASGDVFETIDPGTGAPFAMVARAGKVKHLCVSESKHYLP